MKKLIWALAVSSFFFGAFLPAGWSAEPVKIGLGLPLTGPLAFLGNEFLKGSQLAAEEVNKTGGILGGRKIELVVRDHKGIPAEAVTLAKRLIAEDKVSIIDIDLPSSANIAAHVVSKEMKVVQLTGFGFAPDVSDKGHPYHFRSAPGPNPSPGYWRVFSSPSQQQKDHHGSPNDDYGRGDLASMVAVFKKARETGSRL